MEDAIVATQAGRVRGSRSSNGYRFKGVPYGADTAGARRFQPPLKAAAWSGIRDCQHYGNRAPQIDRPSLEEFAWLSSTRACSEDCLVLNVFTPAPDSARRPVMVWLHGGAFSFGSSDLPIHEGTRLSEFGDVVVVTLNHRLNVFGFLPPCAFTQSLPHSGNAGMLDIVLALTWVKENIATFGGDPDNVTLFGQSGGGAKVAILMAMQEAQGLFHKAIVQSPSSGFRVQESEEAGRFTLALLSRLGLGADDIGQLQQVPAEKLLDVYQRVVTSHEGADLFRPVIDRLHLRRHPFFPEAPKESAAVPMLIGYAATEATFYLAADPSRETLTLAAVRRRLQRFMAVGEAEVDELLAGYQANHPQVLPIDLLVLIASDFMYRLTTIEGAEQKAAAAGADVYLYEFGWESHARQGFLRSPHTAEIPFVFGNIDAAPSFVKADDTSRDLMRQVMSLWVNFARMGNPNGPGLVHWEPFTVDDRYTLVFGQSAPKLETDPGSADRQLISRYPRFKPGSPINFRAD